MQIVPARATTDRRTVTSEPRRRAEVKPQAATPAERIALTIGLLNHGLDLMHGFARTSLRECTRVAFWAHGIADPRRDSHRTT